MSHLLLFAIGCTCAAALAIHDGQTCIAIGFACFGIVTAGLAWILRNDDCPEDWE